MTSRREQREQLSNDVAKGWLYIWVIPLAIIGIIAGIIAVVRNSVALAWAGGIAGVIVLLFGSYLLGNLLENRRCARQEAAELDARRRQDEQT